MKIDKNKLALIIDQVSEDHCNVNTREFRDDLVDKIYEFLTPASITITCEEELDLNLDDGKIAVMTPGGITIRAKSVELKAG